MTAIPLITLAIVRADRHDLETFPEAANEFMGQLPDLADQQNAMALGMNTVAQEIAAVVQGVNTDAETATLAANQATLMAAAAVSAPGTSATSATSLAIGTGGKTMTIQAGKAIVAGMSVKIAASADPGCWMHGDVTAYDAGSGALTVQVNTVHNSGTYAAWSVSLAPPAVDGAINDGRVQAVTSAADTLIDLALGQVIVLTHTVDILSLQFVNVPLACEVIIRRLGAGASGINWISAGILFPVDAWMDKSGENTISLVTADGGARWMASPYYAPTNIRGLALAHGTTPFLIAYDKALAKITNPATLPASTGYGCAFSPDGALLAVAHGGSPYMTIYLTSDWSKLANPTTLPASTGYGCAFSPDGSLLAVAHGSSPYITIYNTNDWSKLANPAILPPINAYCCAFSPDGGKLAVGHLDSPFLTIYNTSDWSKIANPATLPANSVWGCAWSPDGSKLAVAHTGTPFLTIYNTGNWSKIANPATLPGTLGKDCAFSPDGTMLAVAHSGSPSVTIYHTSDWSKLANPATLPAGDGQACAWSADGSRLAVAHSGSPYVTIYRIADWSKIPDPDTLPAGPVNGCAFSPIDLED